MASPKVPKVLLLMDTLLANLVTMTLRHAAYATRTARSLKEASALADSWRPDLVIADYDRQQKRSSLLRKGHARVRSP